MIALIFTLFHNCSMFTEMSSNVFVFRAENMQTSANGLRVMRLRFRPSIWKAKECFFSCYRIKPIAYVVIYSEMPFLLVRCQFWSPVLLHRASLFSPTDLLTISLVHPCLFPSAVSIIITLTFPIHRHLLTSTCNETGTIPVCSRGSALYILLGR